MSRYFNVCRHLGALHKAGAIEGGGFILALALDDLECDSSKREGRIRSRTYICTTYVLQCGSE